MSGPQEQIIRGSAGVVCLAVLDADDSSQSAAAAFCIVVMSVSVHRVCLATIGRRIPNWEERRDLATLPVLGNGYPRLQWTEYLERFKAAGNDLCVSVNIRNEKIRSRNRFRDSVNWRKHNNGSGSKLPEPFLFIYRKFFYPIGRWAVYTGWVRK